MLKHLVEVRRRERHGAAALRAISGLPDAELRGGRLEVEGRPVTMATPYLAVTEELTLQRSRGVADALGLLLLHSDLDLHRELSPSAPLERIIFDVLEQVRCESLVPPEMLGVSVNIEAAFKAWCLDARHRRVGENAVGLLVYTVTHIARARLVRIIADEDVDATIESTRGTLAPLIGHSLRQMRACAASQRAYAVHAYDIAQAIGALAGPVADVDTAAEAVGLHRLMIPSQYELSNLDTTTETDMFAPLGGAGGVSEFFADHADYRVFSDEFDLEVDGSDLYPLAIRSELRQALGEHIEAQAVSISRVAQRMKSLFSTESSDGWVFGEEEGVLDGRRLSQLIAQPANHRVFRRPRMQPLADTVVAFLIDNSGSMKLQRHESVTVLVDTFSRALDLAGVPNEILGFTTAAWAGGRPAAAWRSAGSPGRPGRLNEAMHIVYKAADVSWRRARLSTSSMLRTRHFREGIDGEALLWAHRRLLHRPERRKVLVVISDGVPMDTATALANSDSYLLDHLTYVASQIDRNSPVELGAIGIDHDLSPYFATTAELDLDGTLTLAFYDVLERLFGPMARRSL